MHTAEALTDVHERTHRALQKLMVHCRQLSDEELNRALPGFGYASVRLQLHHAIAAERYWIGVLHGRMDVDDDDDRFPTVASLETFRQTVADLTRAYLRGAAEAELNTPRAMTTWGGPRTLAPASAVMRTQMHLFHHQGQIAAMCRLLGKPSPGADYPLD